MKGEAYPSAIWEAQRQKKTEKITALDGGFFETATIWESVDSISVYGLPEGASLKAYHLRMNLPYEPDLSRPYIHPAYRDQTFSRYWGYENGLLVEYYYSSHYSGMEYAQSHAIIPAMNLLAGEPETFGMFVARGTTLYYADRREPLPDHLDQALLTEEPCWGLDVAYDIDRPGTVRHVRLNPVVYGGTGQAVATDFFGG